MNKDVAAQKIVVLMKRQFADDGEGQLLQDPISAAFIPKRHRIDLNHQAYNARHLVNWIAHGNTVPHTRRVMPFGEMQEIRVRAMADHPKRAFDEAMAPRKAALARTRRLIAERREMALEPERVRQERQIPEDIFPELYDVVKRLEREINATTNLSSKGFGSRQNLTGVDDQLRRLGYRLVLTDEEDVEGPATSVSELSAMGVREDFFEKYNVFLVPTARSAVQLENKRNGVWQI